MRTQKQTLFDVFPTWYNGGGILSAISKSNMPWSGESDVYPESLDLEYYGNVSGGKYVSPLIDQLSKGEPLTHDTIAKIVAIIKSVYGVNWNKQWETMKFDYNPIENYAMTENMADDVTEYEYGKTDTQKIARKHTKTGNEKISPNLTEITTPDLTTENDTSVYGFNSESAVNVGGQKQISSGVNTTTQTGNQQNDYNLTDTDDDSITDTSGGKDTHRHRYTLSRSGNIGVTTSQQMIESERSLWLWNFFHRIVFPDLDRVLTINIY